ncbi:MAG TPA: TCP-1/cpn60 chaperonin family protein [Caldilineaceae bacterium]|nr:TCP-1/cpn60 chaperonin family protein [Caldilineaceae bacterium]
MPKPKVIGQPTATTHFTLGINTIADLLAPTLGPIGGRVVNERDFQRRAELLDDSATTVRRILNLGDPRADVGAMLMRSMVWRVVQRAGDGGATAAVLARALYADAVRIIAAGANAMQVAKGVNLGVAEAVKALKAQARPVTNENDLAHVALTVIREPSLAAVVGEMSYLLGPDAHVTVEKYVASYLQQFYHAGASYRSQIASMYLYTEPPQKRALAPAGMIALVDGKLETVDDVAPILRAAVQANAKSLIIVAGSFSEAVIGLLVTNSRQSDDAKAAAQNRTNGANGKENGAKKEESKKPVIIAVKPKDVGDARRAVFDDLALVTGGTVLGRSWSRPPAQATLADLGRIQRAEYNAERLHVLPERQFSPEVQQRCAELRARLAQMTLDDENRSLVVQRLASLSGGMGVLKIGTESKLDREVRAQNAERALKVLSAAQHTGVVPGGGAAYFHCIPALEQLAAESEGDVAFGVQIVQRSLEAPLRQILDNAHVPASSVIMDRIRRAGPTATYDVVKGEVVDAFEAGVLDVAGVLTTVLQTAASSAMMALTTDTIVYHKKPQQALNP